jgi:hypothetical protein
MFCEKCGATVSDGAIFCSACGAPIGGRAEAAAVTIEYFTLPLIRFVLLSVLTFGIYELYWFYRNWKIIKVAEGKDIRPFWRAVFWIFFCYGLFKRALASAKRRAYPRSFSPGWLTAAYIILSVISGLYARSNSLNFSYFIGSVAVCLLAPLPLLPVLRAMAYNNEKAGFSSATKKMFTGGQVVLIVLGTVVWLLMAIGALYS